MLVVYAKDCNIGWKCFAFENLELDGRRLVDLFNDQPSTFTSLWLVPGTFNVD